VHPQASSLSPAKGPVLPAGVDWMHQGCMCLTKATSEGQSWWHDPSSAGESLEPCLCQQKVSPSYLNVDSLTGKVTLWCT
jgi:hypothetical protein